MAAKKAVLALLLLVLSAPFALSQVSVTGHWKDASGAVIAGDARNYLKFDLLYCGANATLIPSSTRLPSKSFTYKPSALGVISTTLYANSVIKCGTTTGGTRWQLTEVINGIAGPTCQLNVTSSLDLDTRQCDNATAPSVSPAPTDAIYARVDAGNMPFTGPITAPKVNGVLSASVYGSIDAAVTACGSNPCNVIIPADYAGAESANLVAATGNPYKYYNGPSNVTIIDQRASTDPTINYSIKYGGETFANWSRFGVTQNCASTPGSCVGAQLNAMVSGTMNASGGTQTGAGAMLITTGTNFDNTSDAALAAFEAYVGLQHTGGSHVLSNRVYGITSSVNILSTASAAQVATAGAFHAAPCTNESTSGGLISGCYGFIADKNTVGTNRNYGFYNHGNWLSDNATSFDALDSGGLPRHIFSFTNGNYVEFQPLADANGFVFNNRAETTTYLAINSSGITAHDKITAQGGLDANSIGITNTGPLAGVSSIAMGGALSGATTGDFSGALAAGSIKAGASGSVIPDTRELLQSVHSCGTTATCANTANGSYREVFGSVALSSGTPSQATITGISPAFTSTSSYECTCSPNGTTAAIAAGGCAVSKVSTSSITLTGPASVTTVVSYSCKGN